MSGIKRWDIAALGNGFTGMKHRDDGAFVRNSDHEAEVARLRAELQNAAKAALEAVALSCEKEREADALRVDAERYRWLRAGGGVTWDQPWVAIGHCDIEWVNQPNEIEGKQLDDAIDAAMGEGK